MKLIFIVYLIALSNIASAQIPANPEDISPLLIGEKMPDASVKNVDGQVIKLSSLFAKSKTIFIFYRGSWCPYCNRHLAEISQIEKDLIGLGYQIVAVSPDAPENLKRSIDKSSLSYTLLSDQNGDLIKAAGLAFKAPERYEKQLTENQGKGSELILPVPSLFILDENGEILFEHINPNYKTRISGSLVLAAAKAISEHK
jgi:peroxiredoxin